MTLTTKVIKSQIPKRAKQDSHSTWLRHYNTVFTIEENLAQDLMLYTLVRHGDACLSEHYMTLDPREFQMLYKTSIYNQIQNTWDKAKQCLDATISHHKLLLDDPISLDYELVTKAEVAKAVLRSGSPPAKQPRQGNLNTNRDNQVQNV